ncbi:MAG: molybdopterin synthase sulfur carrier subunit [Thaumarchaeota archaeon]|nr:MAG: molybdopterin synthase sulfur carrier subunit [Nitrososphaerota archaeon]
MKITVKSFATIREAFGGRGVLWIELPEGSSIRDLINALEKNYRPKIDLSRVGEENSNIKVLVNGREITYLDGLETKLRDGDVVAFIPPVAGG